MNPKTKIEFFGPVEFVGVALFGNPETTPFEAAWEYFGSLADDAAISRIGKAIYGLQLYHPQFPGKFEMTYMACLEKNRIWLSQCECCPKECLGPNTLFKKSKAG